MGMTFLFVNESKRQYIDPGRFGENSKLGGLFRNYHSVALACLLCEPDDTTRTSPLQGAWSKDRILVVGDDEPYLKHFEKARGEFEDISYSALAMICQVHPDLAKELASQAEKDTLMLIDLGLTAEIYLSGEVREALKDVFGGNWQKKFKEACRVDSWRVPKHKMAQPGDAPEATIGRR